MKKYFRYLLLLQFLLMPVLFLLLFWRIHFRGKWSHWQHAWRYEVVNPCRVTWANIKGSEL